MLLGGGLSRGTSNLFTGPPGSGKSTLALKYAIAMAHRGEKVLIYTFDESINVLHERARGLNIGIRSQRSRFSSSSFFGKPAVSRPKMR